MGRHTSPWSLFRIRNFSLFMLGSFTGATGSWIQSVALGWLVLDLGQSTFWLGMVGFARMVPLLILSFPAGALGDRLDRHKIILYSQLGSAAIGLLLAAAVWFDLATIPLIVILSLMAGVCDAIAWPVWMIFIKDMVGADRLRMAIAVNSTRFNLTRILGPSIGGVLLAGFGAPVCFVVASISYCAVVVVVLMVKLPPYAKRNIGPWLPALREGFRYATGDLDVRRILLLTAGLGLFAMPYQNLLPAIARYQLNEGPEGLGILMASVGIGAIVGAAVTGTHIVQRHAASLILVLPIVSALALIGLGLSQSLPVAIAALVIIGLALIAFTSLANAALQLNAREDMVGRVMGLFTVVQAGVMPLGSLGLGALADTIHLPLTLSLAGGAVIVVTSLLIRDARRSPSVADVAAIESRPVTAR